MRRSLLLLLLTMLLPITTHADENNGKQLHQQHCRQCHDDSVYTRSDSIIFSYKALQKRVRFCETMAAAGWSEQQMNQVIDYLNNTFYQFKTR